MKRIAAITIGLGLGWITAASAMETDTATLPQRPYMATISNPPPDIGTLRFRLSPSTVKPDVGVKNMAPVPLDHRFGGSKQNGNNPAKVYNPISIPLW